MLIKFNSLCIGIRLDDSKNVAGRIFSVGEPADFRDRHLWNANFSTTLFDFAERLIKRRDRDRVHVPGLSFSRMRDTAVDSRFALIAGTNEPVFNRTAFKFLEFPAKHVAIKRLYRFGIVGVNLKMCDAFMISIFELTGSIVVVSTHPLHRRFKMVLVTTFRH